MDFGIFSKVLRLPSDLPTPNVTLDDSKFDFEAPVYQSEGKDLPLQGFCFGVIFAIDFEFSLDTPIVYDSDTEDPSPFFLMISSFCKPLFIITFVRTSTNSSSTGDAQRGLRK